MKFRDKEYQKVKKDLLLCDPDNLTPIQSAFVLADANVIFRDAQLKVLQTKINNEDTPKPDSHIAAGLLPLLEHLRNRSQELWDKTKNLDPHEVTIIGNTAIILDGLEKLIAKLETDLNKK